MTHQIRNERRRARGVWVEELGQQAQNAAQRNDMKKTYRIERLLSRRKPVTQRGAFKQDDGKFAVGPMAEQRAWLEHGLRHYVGFEVAEHERQDGIVHLSVRCSC